MDADKKDATSGEQADQLLRLAKRLTYILRYGALKEGLDVNPNGYVKLEDLSEVGMLQNYTKEDIFHIIKNSTSSRGGNRYEWKKEAGVLLVRAAYLRNFEKAPHHHGTKVNTLVECCLQQVMNNLQDYDLIDFPDEELIRLMIRRLKRKKKLTSSALQTLLVPTITRLDMEDVYLTTKTLRFLWNNCPHLKAISFKNCGYLITDSVLTHLCKNLPFLERLNLSGCDHLTTNCLAIISKRLHNLSYLNISYGPRLSAKAILKFVSEANSIKDLNVYYTKTTQEEFLSIKEAAKLKSVDILLKAPKQKSNDAEADEQIAKAVDLFGLDTDL